MLATAARVYDEKKQNGLYVFTVKSPVNTINAMRILLPAQPKEVRAVHAEGRTIELLKHDWDAKTKTVLLKFDNYSEGVQVTIKW